eukprot:CAMPEP_0115157710 /NCGR_PEP_ID=MMETSP0227-20121206/69182_1 /TAXON_ID=89957 /ORGANISM="Polarella glacialis, Strain CCMP 1383" /LENGTH=115 /DNA_ID=CAMNT_0002569089 /DNA_START=148 /DNA_END=495 /DNA_ORIENTATION=-
MRISAAVPFSSTSTSSFSKADGNATGNNRNPLPVAPKLHSSGRHTAFLKQSTFLSETRSAEETDRRASPSARSEPKQLQELLMVLLPSRQEQNSVSSRRVQPSDKVTAVHSSACA